MTGAVEAAAHEHVGERDASRLDLQAHFAWSGLRDGRRHGPEHLGTAVALDHDLARKVSSGC